MKEDGWHSESSDINHPQEIILGCMNVVIRDCQKTGMTLLMSAQSAEEKSCENEREESRSSIELTVATIIALPEFWIFLQQCLAVSVVLLAVDLNLIAKIILVCMIIFVTLMIAKTERESRGRQVKMPKMWI